MRRNLLLTAAICLLAGFSPLSAADLAILGPTTWQEFVPHGKEVDAIYGDLVLRNAQLTAVIAQPSATRHANMSVKNVGGCLLDFTFAPRDRQNDQLTAWYPLGKAINWRALQTTPGLNDARVTASAETVSVRVTAVIEAGKLTAETTYTLAELAEYLVVETRLNNLSDKPIAYGAIDEIRADGTVFSKGTDDRLAWAYDRWWDAAYGIVTYGVSAGEEDDAPLAADRMITIPAGGSMTLPRKIFLAEDLNRLRSVARPNPFAEGRVVHVADDAGPVAGAYIEIVEGKQLITAGKTDREGRFVFLFNGEAEATVRHAAYVEQKKPLAAKRTEFRFAAPGKIVAAITDEAGGPIPCKVQFRAVGDDLENPFFFDKSGEHAVGNLYYSHTGRFEIGLPPGKYDCTISRGPEYDAVEQPIEVLSGSQSPLAARLVRSVKTDGWISADFHSHSSPSGDNISSQYGRVLNLLCEHVEFAPCTEHNRISTYVPHLKRMGVEHLLATCTGMELTSTPLPLAHVNAFPLHHHPHHQDGGGPPIDADPEVQVERLALWDDRSEKLVQQNHPDLGWLLFDKNGDGQPDGGYRRVLPHLDVIEVHPPRGIFQHHEPVTTNSKGAARNNTIFNWLQLLNQGSRVPGVVNTDAHYNIHGSGWLRNWIASPTDDPARVEVLDIVHEAEHGHIVMSNGPFLEVGLEAAVEGNDAGGKPGKAVPGDDLQAPGGRATLHVRVQCPNWFDIDRVQVFINGRPDPQLNFTRKADAQKFADGPLKFDRKIPLELKSDAHVIVAVIGENSRLGHVMGPEHEKTLPVAVANPIYVDVDGDGFRPNRDTLGAPLPVKAGTAAVKSKTASTKVDPSE